MGRLRQLNLIYGFEAAAHEVLVSIGVF
jgi:hypothetical protein